MKRAVAVTGLTLAGVVWLLTYKISPPHLGALAGSLPTPDASPSPSPSPSTSASPKPTATPSVAPRPTPSPSPSPQAATAGTFTGVDVPNRFGDVQVRVIITNGRITDVQALRLPSDRAESAYISQIAGPMLRTEALQAQSANIDIISGATYTSESYAESLNSALLQAHRA
jgi:uncharacterized protein with FMN-binding domain